MGVRRPDEREAKVRRRQTGDRRQKTIGRHQEPGLGGRKTGWFQVMDGTKYSVSTVPRDCWRAVQVSSSFLLSSAAGAQAATRDEARGEDCTLHSALKRQRVVVRREKERESVGGSDGVGKNAETVLPRSACVPVGLVAPKQQSWRVGL